MLPLFFLSCLFILLMTSISVSGTKTDTENPCHAGSYSDQFGNSAWEQCVDCPIGQYCPAGSVNPTDCPA